MEMLKFESLGLTLVCTMVGQAKCSPISDFDDGTVQGWMIADPDCGYVDNPGTGGNPGGFLRAVDTEGGGGVAAFAPAEFLGDLSSYSAIEYDAYVYDHVPPPIHGVRVSLTGADGTKYKYDPSDWSIGVWEHFALPFNSPLWELVTGDAPLTDVLQDVTVMVVNMECSTKVSVESGIDNFRLVPEPSTAVLLAAASLLALRRRRPSEIKGVGIVFSERKRCHGAKKVSRSEKVVRMIFWAEKSKVSG